MKSLPLHTNLIVMLGSEIEEGAREFDEACHPASPQQYKPCQHSRLCRRKCLNSAERNASLPRCDRADDAKQQAEVVCACVPPTTWCGALSSMETMCTSHARRCRRTGASNTNRKSDRSSRIAIAGFWNSADSVAYDALPLSRATTRQATFHHSAWRF